MFTDFHPATVGGIQTSVNSQRRALQRLGHRVTLFTVPGPPSHDPDMRSLTHDPDVFILSGLRGVLVNGYPMVIPTKSNNRFIDGVFAARGPIDVVHGHTTYGVGILGVRAARRHGLPLVQSVHSRDDAFIEHTSPAPYLTALTMRGLHGLFLRGSARAPRLDESRAAYHAWRTVVGHAAAADAVVVPSHHFARRLRAHGLDRPMHVVSNGIDDELLANLGPSGPGPPDNAEDGPEPPHDPEYAEHPRRQTFSTLRHPATTPEAETTVDKPRTGEHPATTGDAAPAPLRALWCGRLSAEKRPLAAVEAVVLAESCELDIYGGGAEFDKVREIADAAGGRIRLHGEVSQAECLAAMREHDVLLFPSSGFDTQGMALLEAVVVGLPVVYCDRDLAESIPEGGGVRTHGPSPTAIAETLRELATDRDRLAEMREKLAVQADTVRQSQQTEKMLEVYEEASARTGPPRPESEIPTAPGALPLLGHSLHVLRDALGFVTSLSPLGEVVRVQLGPRPAYVVTTPELIREVAFGEAGEFHREELREAMHEIIHEASNVLSGTPHELRRRLVAPALRQRRLVEYAGAAADIAERWADGLRAGRSDLMDEAHRVVLDTISATLFTADFSADAKDTIREHIPWLLGQVIQRAALPPAVRRLRPLADRRFRTRAERMRTEIGAVVTEYRRRDSDFHDVLSALIGHTDPETGARLSDEQIIDELLLMLAAGIGSTASTLGWLWHELMRNQEVAARVRAEMDEVVGAGPVRPEHAGALPYLRQVLQETLRMWAPWVSTQTAAAEVRVGAFALPPGATVVFSPYMIHHDARWFPDPETFDPDRWSPGRAEAIDRAAVLPFSVGPRHCPGSNFAMMTIILQTAALLTRWETVPQPGYRVRPSSRDFVAAPARLPVALLRRQAPGT
ncbi:cytochrome P450 [Nocardia mexicana]|uniref:Cytochrome P450 n=2 Tax=Nocardia mexicana TaxID=279262 RepID=A0A370HC28_9NOCA|nr:cytochrome P450 [Nocardia mexicana]